MASSDVPKLTAPQQIAVLQGLSQQAAAWILGLSDARTLRNKALIPRSVSGAYDARELLRWAAKCLPPAELTDDQTEVALTICEQVAEAVPAAVPMILAFLADLESKHGDAGLALFGRFLTASLQAQSDGNPQLFRAVAAAELQARVEKWREQEIELQARRELRVCVKCDRCGKIRQGVRWRKAAPPIRYAIDLGICPGCEALQ